MRTDYYLQERLTIAANQTKLKIIAGNLTFGRAKYKNRISHHYFLDLQNNRYSRKLMTVQVQISEENQTLWLNTK